jgi:hypothetical protein
MYQHNLHCHECGCVKVSILLFLCPLGMNLQLCWWRYNCWWIMMFSLRNLVQSWVDPWIKRQKFCKWAGESRTCQAFYLCSFQKTAKRNWLEIWKSTVPLSMQCSSLLAPWSLALEVYNRWTIFIDLNFDNFGIVIGWKQLGEILPHIAMYTFWVICNRSIPTAVLRIHTHGFKNQRTSYKTTGSFIKTVLSKAKTKI